MDYKEIFVPGRLCLLGEHSDWASSYSGVGTGTAIVSGIDLGITAKYKISNKTSFKYNNYLLEITKNTNLDEIAKSEHFLKYVAGTIKYILENYKVGNVEIIIKNNTLPIKKGLSSSACICVLITKIYNDLFNLNLSIEEEMNIAYYGERNTNSLCGRLDQLCAYGKKLILVKFKGEKTITKVINKNHNIYMVFADLNKSKDTIKILKDLNANIYNFKKTIGSENRKIIKKSLKAIEKENNQELGTLFNIAQNEFDKNIAIYSDELKAPCLHTYLNDPYIKELTYGGKGVGSQGDGSVQFIAKNKEDQEKLVKYLNKTIEAYKVTL